MGNTESSSTDIRIIIDQTAKTVAKRGREIEEQIRSATQDNAEYGFLDPSDSYHAYYQSLVLKYQCEDTEDMICPPADVRNIVRAVASHVAKNGRESGQRIADVNAGNQKFGFLNPSDDYHAYYQSQLMKFESEAQSIECSNFGFGSS